MNELLTPLAQHIFRCRPDAYQKLVVKGKTPEEAHRLLDGVTPDQLLLSPPKSHAYAKAMLCGMWLWHDGLHECHEIAQMHPSLGNDDASEEQSEMVSAIHTLDFWHAIMHRREGDFSNAKYWYARCADHRAMRTISAMGMDVIGRSTKDRSLLKIVGGEYNPDALVDLVEQIHDQPGDPRFAGAVRVQQMEWEALFQHCVEEAAGAPGGTI
jgi:hypothetical protein